MKKRNRRISFFKEVQRFPMILVFFLFCHADDSGAAQTRIFAEHSVNTTFVFHCQLILVYTIFIYQCVVYSFCSQLAQAFVEFSRTSLLVSISCDDEFVFRKWLSTMRLSSLYGSRFQCTRRRTVRTRLQVYGSPWLLSVYLFP